VCKCVAVCVWVCVAKVWQRWVERVLCVCGSVAGSVCAAACAVWKGVCVRCGSAARVRCGAVVRGSVVLVWARMCA